ncbi:MAG: hypothetical protein ABIZ34_03955 [Candidatus Limnocylindrales bacterium]
MDDKKVIKKVIRRPGDIEPTGNVDPAGDDTEGHSMLQLELARNVASSRSREAAEWARSEKARRASKGQEKRSR